MLVRLLEKYGEIIKSWEIIDFDSAGPNYRVRAEILFVDGTRLYVRQVVLGESVLKYAYQWNGEQGVLLCRWDNAPHWQKIPTFPHHKHVAQGAEVLVRESRGGDLEEILEEIAIAIRGKSTERR